LRVVIRDVYSSGRQNSHEIPGIWKRRQGLAPIGRNARSGPRGSKRPGHASTHRTPRAIMTVNARAPRKIAWPLRCGIADAMIRRGCQRWSKILPQGGAKAGHFGFGREARHEAAASQPRSPCSWRLTDLAALIRTSVLLLAQGWRDHDDACALRHDPAFRLASGSAAGLSPLGGPGLASQPTLSRFAALLELAGRGIRAERGGNKMACVTLDVDSAPIEVHGHQPKAEWTGRGRASATWPWCALMRVFLRQPCWRALRHAGSTMSRVCAPTRPQDPV